MKIGRNDPCHCGSGRKYKKCCLQKDELARISLAAEVQARAAEAEARKSEEKPIEITEWEPEPLDADDTETDGPALEASSRPPLVQYPRPDEDLPILAPEQERIVEDWWEKTNPFYRKRDVDQLLKRVESALIEIPELFVHLALHEELLFELGSEMGRRGRMPEYVGLLKRLRREQRQMYSFSYGAYDSDVIAELVIAGQNEEIPAYFDLFKEYPDDQPDYCHQICNLLAWRGLAEPLNLLCEAVATPMLTSSEMIGGNFALDWLIRREEIPFYEAGDASSGAVERMAEAIKKLGERLQFPLEPDANWLRASLEAYLETPRAGTQGSLSDKAQHRLALNFVAFLVRVRKVPWVQGFHLGEVLKDYFFWCRREQIPRWRLEKRDMEAFVVRRSRDFLLISGVTMLSIIQTMIYLADYLQAAGAVTGPDRDRITEDCRQLYETGRKSVDSTDPAYRLCPTFEQLTADHPT